MGDRGLLELDDAAGDGGVPPPSALRLSLDQGKFVQAILCGYDATAVYTVRRTN
jgi:hypothetical protein